MRDENDFLSQAAGRNSGCLTVEQLEALAAGNGTAAHRRHVDGCRACQTEVDLLTRFLLDQPSDANEAATVAHIARRLEAEPRWRPASSGETKAGVEPRRSWWENLFASPIRGFALAGLAAMLAVGVWIQQRPVEPGVKPFGEVTRSSGQPEGLAPVGDLAQAPVELRWNPVAEAAQYEVKLLEVDGSELWRTRVSGPAVALPETVRAVMAPRKKLYWSVSALNTQGAAMAPVTRQPFRVVPGGH